MRWIDHINYLKKKILKQKRRSVCTRTSAPRVFLERKKLKTVCKCSVDCMPICKFEFIFQRRRQTIQLLSCRRQIINSGVIIQN